MCENKIIIIIIIIITIIIIIIIQFSTLQPSLLVQFFLYLNLKFLEPGRG